MPAEPRAAPPSSSRCSRGPRTYILGRLAEFGGLAYHATPEGKLRMYRADDAPRVPVELVRPGNILELDVARDERDRYSHYMVVAQGVHGFDEDTSRTRTAFTPWQPPDRR